jgi:hypothetical protein
MSGDYVVGNKRPPKAARFKPGQSGNPAGRPRGSRNISTIIETVLDERISVTEAGRRRSMSTREAIIRGLRNDALRGDHKARLTMIGLDMQVEAARGGTEPDKRQVTEADAKVMARLVERIRKDIENEKH